ncbi:MAG: disulfide bond formation protein DsbA [Acidobacteria bacterium]|nr:MAG: disulfide bond formation protein DsbA [Acidobacteriota bacterium]
MPATPSAAGATANAQPASDTSSPSGAKEPGAVPPHAQGPENAPVTLEEFGDFQCPPCGMLHPVLKQMEGEFRPKLRIIFREFPLVPTHEHALAAARAAEAAGLQGKFWEMHDILYENQKAWHDVFDIRPVFEGYATKIGLDLDRYRRDLSSNTVEQRIFLDGKRGHSLNVTGTPTVFLNGKEIPFESLAPEKLRVLIQNASNGK